MTINHLGIYSKDNYLCYMLGEYFYLNSKIYNTLSEL